jgi:gas vesicle protein
MKSKGEFKFPYFQIAAGVRAIAGLLFAPRSGEDTREYFWERSTKGLDYLNRRSGKLLQSAQGLMKKGKGFIGRQNRDSVKTDTEAEEQAYQEERREHSGG